MTQQRALSPLTLLLASLLCYGFMLVWTQNIALESTTAFEDLSTPFSSAGVKILTGGNFSVSVAPGESPTKPPVVNTQSSLAIHSTINESITFPMTTVMESQPNMVSVSGAEITSEEELTSTGAPLDTTTSNGINSLTEGRRSTTELEMSSESNTGMLEGNNGIPTSPSVSANSSKVSPGTTMAGDTTDTTATSTGAIASSDLDALPRAMKTSSTGGKLIWRVTLRSALSREEAITAFYEKSCEVIIKNLHMKDVAITVGPKRLAIKCV